MAPKTAANKKREEEDDGLTPEQREALAESKRIQEEAIGGGVLAKARRLPAMEAEGKPANDVLKSNGCDIVKKSAPRRHRYLLVLNGLISPSQAGQFGTLAKLDSRNPVMYIDFPPEGRAKLQGTLVFPANKYMVIRPGSTNSRGQVQHANCEDCFESMIVFSSIQWVGKADDNPNEESLPWPLSIRSSQVREYASFAGGAGSAREGAATQRLKAQKQDVGADDLMGAGPSQQEVPLSQRRSGRTAGKSFRYNEDQEEGGESEDEGGSHPSASRGTSQDNTVDVEEEIFVLSQTPVKSRPAAKRRRAASFDGEDTEHEPDLDEDLPASQRHKRMVTQKRQVKYVESSSSSSSSEEEAEDEDDEANATEGTESEEEERPAKKKALPKKPQQAKGRKAKKTEDSSEDSEEEEEEEDESDWSG